MFANGRELPRNPEHRKTLNNFDSQINRLIRIERSILRTKIETGRTRSLTEQFHQAYKNLRL